MTPENIPGLSQFITVVIGVAVTIGFLVLLQAMYAAVLERTREIGILKSMGASQLYILNLILRETEKDCPQFFQITRLLLQNNAYIREHLGHALRQARRCGVNRYLLPGINPSNRQSEQNTVSEAIGFAQRGSGSR